MIQTIPLPDIGEGVVEGEVVRWLKKEGDTLKKDEAVVVVMTDKATVELPTPYQGVLVKCYVEVGKMAKRGEPLYDVEVESVEILAAPRTRQLAKDLGVDLNKVKGTGEGGRVTDADVVHYQTKEGFQPVERAKPPIVTSTPPLHLSGDIEKPQQGIRQIIAEKMIESSYIVPHFSFFDRLDATRLVQMRTKWKERALEEKITLTYMPFVIRALSLTILKYPEVNASLDLKKNSLILHKHQHIGIAIETKEGLVVAKLEDVQEMNLEEIIRSYDALIRKAKEGALTHKELTGSTITLSNFGVFGGRWATPIINYPEVAILGLAKIAEEAVVVSGEVVARSMMNLSWSFDHRVIDGSLGARVSSHFISLMEHPAGLL